MKKYLITIGCVLVSFNQVNFAKAISKNSYSYKSCLEQPKKQKARSLELQELVKADQKVRENFVHQSLEEQTSMAEEDRKRRQRVGEIFGEGCFKNIEDYQAAALIYQHGDTPDHFYQSFVWSNEAMRLGSKKDAQGVAVAIDRYLVTIGHKQLFGTQALIVGEKGDCLCFNQNEKTVPASMIKKYGGMSLEQRVAMYVKLFNVSKSCEIKECPGNLQPTPKGTVPGFW